MNSTPKLLLTAATLALAGAPAAHAAEGFAGITASHKLVSFHSDRLPAFSTARTFTGLAAGDSLFALDRTPDGHALGLGVSGKVYDVDLAGASATLRLDSGLGALDPTAPTTFSVTPDGATLRIIAAGRDESIALADNSVTHNDPAAAAVIADVGADGVLRGIDPAKRAVVTLDAAGEHVIAPIDPSLALRPPTSVTTGSDGRLYATTRLASTQNIQSRVFTIDPATGATRGLDPFLFEGLDTATSVGSVPDDTTAPTARVHIPRQSLQSILTHHGVRVVVTTSEPGQTVMSARTGSQMRAFGFATAIHKGRMTITAGGKLSSLRKLGGHRVRVHLAIHDFAGNTKLIDRWFTVR